MWTHAVKFPDPRVEIEQEDGTESVVDNWGESVTASFKDTTRKDETAAMQLGYDADQNIEVHKSAYNGQGYLLDVGTGTIYDIKRTFLSDKANYIVLTCKKREPGKVVRHGQGDDYRV